MLDYKRFISYLYAYVDGEKGVNVGYIRCDQRQGNCRLVLNLQDRQGIEGGKYKVYLYRVESEQSPVGYYLDEFCINKNCGELKKQTMSENVWNTNRGINEFDGIIAIYDKTHIYASQWTDTPLDVRRFLTYADWQKQRKQSSETWEKSSIQALTPEAQPTQMPSQAQSQTLQEQMQSQGSPEIQLIETFTSEAQSAQTAFSEAMSPQGQEQEQMRSQTQTQMPQEQGQSQEQMQSQAQSQMLQEQMQPQAQGSPKIQLTETFTSEAQSAQTALSEAMSPQGQLQEQMRSQVQTQMSQEQGQSPEQMSSQAQSQMLQEQMQPQAPSQMSQEQMQVQGQQQEQPQETRKSQQSRPQANGAKNFNGTANSRKCISELTLRLMENRAKLPDFENHEIYDCVRIEPNDIGLLEMENWRLGVNSFLTHGYYNYKYLMLGKLRFQDGVVKAVLGVPGVFNNKEQYIAKIFGFDLFVPVKHTNIRTGNFGYWIVELV